MRTSSGMTSPSWKRLEPVGEWSSTRRSAGSFALDCCAVIDAEVNSGKTIRQAIREPNMEPPIGSAGFGTSVFGRILAFRTGAPGFLHLDWRPGLVRGLARTLQAKARTVQRG